MLTQSLLFLPTLSLFACEIGLKTGAIPEDTGFEEPSSEPSSDPWDTNTTDTTDTAGTTDTTDTNDTQDTNDSGTLIPNLITSVSPGYGSTAGGTLISIMGGPFTSDATVSFGGNPGVVISNNGSMIRVNTPSAVVGGAVEIKVDMDDGYGIASDPYIYFADALGMTSTIGIISYVEYIGQYWTGGVVPDPMASAWTAFTDPIDFHWYQFNTPALDTCARNSIDANGDGNPDGVAGTDYYQFSGQLTVVDIGANQVSLNGVSNISLTRGSSDPNSVDYYIYENAGTLPPSSVPEQAFFDLSIQDGPLAGMTVAQYARSSKRSEPYSPSLNTATLQAVSATQTFNWSTTGADWVEIRMYQIDTSGNIVSDVICNAVDDGNFTMQNLHQAWTPGNAINVQFTRMYESNVSMPQNDGIGRVVGAYTIAGGGYMN